MGFHVRHAAGSLDRLFTYARGETLSATQRAALETENDPDLSSGAAIDCSPGSMPPSRPRSRSCGRRTRRFCCSREASDGPELPSTVFGLLFHAAEHTQRHAGQAVTTIKIALSHRSGEQD